MVWGFCYLRIFKKMHSISGHSLPYRGCLNVQKKKYGKNFSDKKIDYCYYYY
jgi:hypothetical protein